MADRFLTQRFVNAYPRWTKARRDPSSVAQRFYSPLAEMMANEYAGTKKQSQAFNLLRDWLPFSSLFHVALEQDDFFPKEVAADGTEQVTYPTSVTLDLGAGAVACSRVDDADDLFTQVPTAATLHSSTPVSNWLVYDTDVGTYQPVDYPSKLWVVVSESDEYYLRNRGEFTSGRFFVDIRGYDYHGNEITDRVDIRDDGLYETKEIFSELLEVRQQGFNGRVQVYLASAQQGYTNPYYLGADIDNVGPLYHRLDETGGGEPVLKSFIDRELFGARYRRKGEVLELDDTEIWAEVLRDSGGSAVSGLDIAFDWQNGNTVLLDDQGFVHWYDAGRTEFTELSRMSQLTTDSYLEVHPLTHWAVLDDTLKMFTRFQRPRIVISKVRITRIKPGGTVEYLQSNLTWSVADYWFQYQSDPRVEEPVRSWIDLTFDSVMDEVGEWEFYCETREAKTGTVTMVGTKVAVPAQDALVSLDTTVVSSLGETPERLCFDRDGRLAVGTAEGNLHHIDLLYHYYYADTEGHALWFAPLLNIETPPVVDGVEVTY